MQPPFGATARHTRCRVSMRALVPLFLVFGCAMGGKKSAMAVYPSSPSRLEQHAGLDNAGAADPASASAVNWRDIVVADDSVQHSGTSATPQAPATATAQVADAPPAKQAEKLVVEAWIYMRTANVAKAAHAISTRVEQSGGHVVSENINGSESSASSAALEFRIPPAQTSALTTWLGTLGTVTSQRMQATEVSKTLFDQELALQNLELTMGRLQALAEKGGPIETVLAVEKELTRVRGDIERVRGERRWLLDRVAYATISVTLEREGDEEYDLVPEARIHPGPMVSTLVLIDPGMRQRTRAGAGMSLRVRRYLTFDLSVFPRGDGGDSRAVIATVGTALYSGYLGYGQRRYLNPYIGARAGYGYLSHEGGAAIAAELGIELFKHEYLLVETAVRAVAFVRESGNQAALQGTLGVAVPF